MHFLFLGHHKLNFQSLKNKLRTKKLALCTPIGVRKTVIPMYSKRPNENGQKSLYQSRNGFITNGVTGLWLHQLNHHADNVPRGTELAVQASRGDFRE